MFGTVVLHLKFSSAGAGQRDRLRSHEGSAAIDLARAVQGYVIASFVARGMELIRALRTVINDVVVKVSEIETTQSSLCSFMLSPLLPLALELYGGSLRPH